MFNLGSPRMKRTREGTRLWRSSSRRRRLIKAFLGETIGTNAGPETRMVDVYSASALTRSGRVNGVPNR